MGSDHLAMAPSRPGLGRDHLLAVLIALLVGFLGGFALGRMEPARPARGGDRSASGAARPDVAADGATPLAGAVLPERIAPLERLFAERPKDADLAVELGNAWFDAGRFDRARELYEVALPSRSTDPDLLTDLGVCYRNLGDSKKALSLFEKAAAADPKHWKSRFNLAIVLSLEGESRARALAIVADLKKSSDSEAVEAAKRLERAIEAHGGTRAVKEP